MPTNASGAAPKRSGPRLAENRCCLAGVAGRHQDRLELEVRLEALRSALAADARVLVAAERCARIERVPVDRVRAGADLLRDLDALRDVGGVHRTGQAVVRVVGDLDGLVDRVVGDHRQDGAEDLLAGDRHRVVDVGEDGRLDEEAIAERRSTRAYKDQKITREQIDILLKAARESPSARNSQPWYFSVTENTSFFKEINAEVVKVLGEDVGDIFHGAPLAIFLSCDASTRWGRLDCGIAVMSMAAAASSLGLGCVPIGGIRNNPGDIIDLLGLPPLTYAPIGLAVGHVDAPSLKRPRMDLSTFRHDETYHAEGLEEAITAYDKALYTFWQAQDRKDGQSWSDSIAPRFDSNDRPLLKPVLAKQGMAFKD